MCLLFYRPEARPATCLPWLFVVLMLVPSGWAQLCKPRDPGQSISTDRPSFTNSSTTVPCRTLQFENGFNETAVQGQRGWDLPQTSVRFGALTRTELRLTAPDYFFDTQTPSSFATGLGDLSAGVKQQLGPIHGFDLAAIASLSFPSGSQAISSHGYDTNLQLSWSRKVLGSWTAEGDVFCRVADSKWAASRDGPSHGSCGSVAE